MSVWLWNLKIVGRKKQILAKNQHTQGNFFLNIRQLIMVHQKVLKIVLSKSIFNVKNQLIFFQKKLRLRPNILAKRLGGRSLSRLMKNFGP